jgi:hypothetical protein
MSGKRVPLAAVVWLAAAIASASAAGPTSPRVIDSGPENRQVASDGRATYLLKNDGRILARSGQTWVAIEGSPRARLIAASRGQCYAVALDGSLWKRAAGHFERLLERPGTRQMIAVANRFMARDELYTVRDDGTVWQLAQGQWTMLSNQAVEPFKSAQGSSSRSIAVDQDGQVYLLDGGNVWEHCQQGDWHAWLPMSDAGGAREIESALLEGPGDDGGAHFGLLYVLAKDGQIWRRSDGRWQKIGHDASTVELRADDQLLYRRDAAGAVHVFQGERWWTLPLGAPAVALEARGGRVDAITKGGRILDADVYELLAPQGMKRPRRSEAAAGPNVPSSEGVHTIDSRWP